MTRSTSPTEEITPNSFITTVSPANGSTSSRSSTIIFFIPGNPGLVAYYHLYLSLLARELSAGSVYFSSSFSSSSSRASSSDTSPTPQTTTKKSTRDEKAEDDRDPRGAQQCPAGAHDEYFIYGRSLAGFEIEDSSGSAETARRKADGMKEDDANAKPSNGDTRLYGLTEEIEFVEQELAACVATWRKTVGSSTGERGKQKARVILVGHSVGSYLAMEIMRRRQERETLAKLDGDEYHDDATEIIGGVMLFPTVVDIAKSPSGRKLSLLLSIPRLDALVSLFAKTTSSVLPKPVLRELISIVMKRPREEIIDITTEFMKSKCGPQQAIRMAADEMRDITVDKWNDEVWGISNPEIPSRQPAKLVFYFGRNDHWVAEQTRDDIIRIRSLQAAQCKKRGPKIVVCDDHILHGFCVGHSDIMARKTARFIQDIVNEQDV